MIKCIILISLLTSCFNKPTSHNIKWLESRAICIHWSHFGKENFVPKAVKIVLKASNSSEFNDSEFYLNSEKLKQKTIKLNKVDSIKHENDNYYLFLFVKSEQLYEDYPEGQNSYYNDDCYQIELTNIIGLGQVVMEKDGKSTPIGKSPDYIMTVGPQ
ncbi:MAG: hypothetical protein R2774_06860 [Saprospiraceae bacterium]